MIDVNVVCESEVLERIDRKYHMRMSTKQCASLEKRSGAVM